MDEGSTGSGGGGGQVDVQKWKWMVKHLWHWSTCLLLGGDLKRRPSPFVCPGSRGVQSSLISGRKYGLRYVRRVGNEQYRAARPNWVEHSAALDLGHRCTVSVLYSRYRTVELCTLLYSTLLCVCTIFSRSRTVELCVHFILDPGQWSSVSTPF